MDEDVYAQIRTDLDRKLVRLENHPPSNLDTGDAN